MHNQIVVLQAVISISRRTELFGYGQTHDIRYIRRLMWANLSQFQF